MWARSPGASAPRCRLKKRVVARVPFGAVSRITLDFPGARPTMHRMVGGFALLLVSTASTAAESSTPWYERDACRTAHATLMTAELDRGLSAVAKLQRSSDIELRACGAWLQVVSCDVEFILEGRSSALDRRRMRRLERLFKFAMRYGRARPHLLDLAIEARMRRVRVLVARGQRTRAVDEARKVEKMLDGRRAHARTPTRMYARGVADLAVAQTPWALRVLVSMAGIGGDAERGRRFLETLGSGSTVYRAEALLALYHLAPDDGEGAPPAAGRYGALLAKGFAQHPQFVFDHALDQFRAGRCADVLAILAPARSRLHADPELWSPRVRKKVYWLTGRCALDTGDKPLAEESLGLAARQRHGSYAQEVALLRADLAI